MNIPSNLKRTVWVAWLVAVFINLVFGLIVNISFTNGNFSLRKPSGIAVLIFPLIGLALLGWAIRETSILRIYGTTYFVSNVDRFSRGETLKGRIDVNSPSARLIGKRFRLILKCQVQGASSERMSNKSVYTIWHDSRIATAVGNGSIPVEIPIPDKIEYTTYKSYGRSLLWSLQVKEISGGFMGFSDQYIIPVARAKHDPEGYSFSV